MQELFKHRHRVLSKCYCLVCCMQRSYQIYGKLNLISKNPLKSNADSKLNY